MGNDHTQETTMDYETELAAIAREENELRRQENALRERRQAAQKAQIEALEAAAGDVKAGDLVVVKTTYGAAKEGTPYIVEERYRDNDHHYEVVRLDGSRGHIIIPLSCVVRVPAENAAALWKQIEDNRHELRKIVRLTLNMWVDV